MAEPEKLPWRLFWPHQDRGWGMGDDVNKFQLAQWTLERHLGWITAAEVKAGVVVTLDAAMFAAVATAFSALDQAHRTAWGCLLTTACGVCLVIGLFCIAMVFLPRLTGPKHSHIFFGCIAQQSGDEFRQAYRAATSEQLLDDCLAQIHRNAEIARDKFGWVRCGMLWSFAALPFWIAALAVLVQK